MMLVVKMLILGPCHWWGLDCWEGIFNQSPNLATKTFLVRRFPSLGEWGKKRLMSEYPPTITNPPLSELVSGLPSAPSLGLDPAQNCEIPPLNLRCGARREDLIWSVRGANTEPGRRSGGLIWSRSYLPTPNHFTLIENSQAREIRCFTIWIKCCCGTKQGSFVADNLISCSAERGRSYTS